MPVEEKIRLVNELKTEVIRLYQSNASQCKKYDMIRLCASVSRLITFNQELPEDKRVSIPEKLIKYVNY